MPGTEAFNPAILTDEPGSLLASTSSALTSGRGTFRGTLISAVYLNPATNGLDFYFQLINEAESRDAITVQSHGGFEGLTTSVGFRKDGAALGGPFSANGMAAPSVAVRSDTGGTVAFSFHRDRLQPGTASRIVVVQTDARFFQLGAASMVDAGVATANTFAPSTEDGSFKRDTGTLTLTTGSGTLSAPADWTLRDWHRGKAPVEPAVSVLPRVVSGSATDVSSQVKLSQTGFSHNRSTGMWVTSLTVKNTSFATIQGPIEVVFNNLPPGVTLVNASGIYNGSPYITVTGSSLAAGASVSVMLEFMNPTNGFISYTPVTYSGSIAAPVCTPDGGTCTLNNPGACCSSACSSNNGNPICCNFSGGPFGCFN